MSISLNKKTLCGAAMAAIMAQGAAFATPPSGGGGGGNAGPVEPGEAPTRGPNPTASALERSDGPYTVRSQSVSSFVSGFGGGTIWYPTNAGADMAAIAVVPGFVSPESSIRWWGERLASWGFVVITIATNSLYDNEDSRATQLGAALDYLVAQGNSSSSPIRGLVDADRLGAMGWSMGGGGSLELATRRDIRAIIPQAPYYSGSNDFDEIDAATFIIACESDTVAPVSRNASPFYNTVPSSTPKLYIEINNGSHSCANSGNPDEDLLGKIGVSWMKRFMDGDTRFEPYLCSTNYAAGFDVSEQRNSCGF